jgi:transposase
MRFVGIDVGSQSHMVAIVDEVGQVQLKPTSFAEDAEGYEKLRKLLGEAADCLVVLEATGHYAKNLIVSLVGWGFPVAVLNPLRTRRFAEEDLTRAKTDSVDALGIARFGALKRPSPTVGLGEANEQIRELVRLRLRLVQDHGDRQRQLHRLHELDSDIEARISQHELGALLTMIDGIGALSVAHIVAAVGDPARFRDASAFAAYVGVVPGTRQSGLWQPGRSRLCPIGNARLRKALWMPTLSAVRCNTWLAAYYRRLRAKGKPPKVALVAAMRKLMTAIYSVAKSRKPFVPWSDPSKS